MGFNALTTTGAILSFHDVRHFRSSRERSNNYRRLERSQSNVDEDDDVIQERERLATTPLHVLTDTHALVMQELTKSYGRTVAVDRLSIGMQDCCCCQQKSRSRDACFSAKLSSKASKQDCVQLHL